MRDTAKFGAETTASEAAEGIDLSGKVALVTGGSRADWDRRRRASHPGLGTRPSELRGEPRLLQQRLAFRPGAAVRDHPPRHAGVRDAPWRDVHARSTHHPARRGERRRWWAPVAP